MKLLIEDRIPIVVFDNGIRKKVEKLSRKESLEVIAECHRRMSDLIIIATSILQRNQIPTKTPEPLQYISSQEDRVQFIEITAAYDNAAQWLSLIDYQLTEASKLPTGMHKSLADSLAKIKKEKPEENA